MGIKGAERAILVGVALPKIRPWLAQEHLEELRRLAETAEAEVVAVHLQRLTHFHPATLIGAGKLEQIAAEAQATEADLIIFDEDLTGSQVRNLEGRFPGIKVLDRTGLILDIFARHAQTAESRLMVEVAQLEYMMPRLTRAWTHLCRQVGGIGTRGPGETQLEVDRRLVRKRIQELKKKLSKIEKARNMQAERREHVFQVAVVGYTNAGKSTLTNALTKADVLVEDKLFATLDATTRQLFLDTEQKVILSDTVGFIRKLPHHLVQAFRSTLGVAVHADCILEVIDTAAPDYREHMEVTAHVLETLIDSDIPRIRAFNKVDVCDPPRREEVAVHWPEAVLTSAREKIGLEALRHLIAQQVQTWQAQRLKEEVRQQETVSNWD